MEEAATKPQVTRREVTIIGGGIAGCLTALMLARRQNYHVRLIEAQPELLNGASIMASRLHLGGEYPLDPQTMRDCIKAASIWKLNMPEDIYTKCRTMRFFTTEEAAEQETLTPPMYMRAYQENVVKPYEDIIVKINARKPLRKKQDIQYSLFGKPDKLLRFVHRKETREFADDSGDTHVAGGFISKEPGLDIPLYLSAIEDELGRQQREGNIEIITNCKVKKDGLQRQPGGSYKISCVKDGEDYVFNAPQVVQTVAEHGPEITPLRPESKMAVYNRAMILLDTTKCKNPISPTFIIDPKGAHGGMISPYHILKEKGTAIGYVPSEVSAYRGGDTTLTHASSSIPNDWEEIPSTQDHKRARDVWMRSYFKELLQRFPMLEGARPIGLIVRNTINFQESLEQRRHEITKETERGLVVANPTKLTFAVQTAMEAADLVEQRSRLNDAERKSSIRDGSLLIASDALELALSGRYSLANMAVPQNPERIKRWCEKHRDTFPPNWVPQSAQDSSPPSDFHSGRAEQKREGRSGITR